MNKNLFELSQEEKNRIRGLHESYINKPGTKVVWEGILQPKENKIISEQKVKLFGMGIFEISGNELFYRQDEKSEKVKIWEKNSADELVRFNYTNSIFEPTGVIKVQNDYIFSNPSNKSYAKKISNTSGGDRIFGGGDFTKRVSDYFYFFALNDKNQIVLNVSAVVSVTNKTIKDPNSTMNLNIANPTKNLVRTKGNEIVYKETYVRLRRNINCAIKVGVLLATSVEPDIKNKTINLSLDLVDVFDFDKLNFVNEISTNQKIDNFVNQVKNYSNTYGENFRRQMNAKLINNPVLGYASIDTDPSDTQIGTLPGCQDKKTNGEYNNCLSEKRAKRVSDLLNEKLSDLDMIGGKFTYKGMGGTKLFGPGYPEVKDETKTGENRRVVFEISDIVLDSK